MSSQNLTIRRAEPEDFRGLQRIHEQPRAIWGTLQVPFPSAELWRRRLEELTSNHYFLVACSEQEIVGCVGLFAENGPRRRHAANVGIAVHDQWQSRGIGSALLRAAVDLADRWLGLTRLELTVYADNEPALKLYRKFGFAVEGRLARYAFRDGAFVDVFTMARLR